MNTTPTYNQKAVEYYEEGRALHQNGKLSAAERAYRKSIKISPDFVEAYNNLGNVLVDQSRFKEASHAYTKALKFLPNHPMLLNNLGNVFQLQGENQKAISWFNKAITQDPNYPDTHNNLGNALRELGRYEEAVTSYQQALKFDLDLTETYTNLGALLTELGKLDDAVISLEKAIEIDPEHVEAYVRLGNALWALEQWDKAAENYRQAIVLEPDYAEAYHYLSLVKNFGRDDEIVTVMENLYQNPNISAEQRMHLSFALGKVHTDLADYEETFSYIHHGNQLKWSSLQYDVETETRYFEQIKLAFSPDAFNQVEVFEQIETTPVFILGLPRSGKTLTETMLAKHPLVYPAGEQDILKKTIAQISDMKNPQKIVDRMLGLSKDKIVRLAELYIHQVKSLSDGEPFIVDTNPINFYYVGFIKLLFPNAKVIHCYRQPEDACWFIYQKYFSLKKHHYSFDLAALGAYYKGYSDLMSHWHSVLPGYIHDLQYERLVTETSHELSQLFAFTGLDWDGTCLDRYENNPLHDNDIGSWRNYRDHLVPLLEALN